ncbi:Protein apcdd1 [Homalodisca vitripennis]|nr:Protein apcdd1 [Homalodisca vitripennis]
MQARILIKFLPKTDDVDLLQIGGCDVCHAVSKGWERAPPQLLSQPRLPPLLAGEWTSARCESRPLGIFLSRRLLVIGHQWSATYRFFSDPKCTQATLTASVRGHFSQTPGPSRVQGAADFDFHVEGASVILLDQGLRDSLQRSGGCGTEEEWKELSYRKPLPILRQRSKSSGVVDNVIAESRRPFSWCVALLYFHVLPLHFSKHKNSIKTNMIKLKLNSLLKKHSKLVFILDHTAPPKCECHAFALISTKEKHPSR